MSYGYKLLLHIKDIGKAIRRENTLFGGLEAKRLKKVVLWLQFVDIVSSC